MPASVRLLGVPEIQPGPPPRGHKAWGVLAYLALAERPVARSQLADLLFGDARDPLGALRWTLAQVRRALQDPHALRGDPVALRGDLDVDARALAAGALDPGLARGELLEGIEPGGGPTFDSWLLVERRRLAGLSAAALREAALEALAHGRPLEGARLAQRMLALDEFEESAHELLVLCLARGGEVGAARHHANACEVLFLRELGRAPDPRVRRAAEVEEPSGAVGDRAVAAGQLDAGRAALDAGAVEPGIACLRLACAEARAVDDPALLSQALAALGIALVHAVRGRDEEAAAVLHEALRVAEAAGDCALAAEICRELGFVEVQAARGASAGRWLLRATELAQSDAARAAILGVRGMALSDRAHYVPAMELLRASLQGADSRQTIWSLSLLGRSLLLRGDLDAAVETLDEALARVEEERWLAFQPFPEALRAEAALQLGDLDRAEGLVRHAFSLGCRLGDPCWEGMAARAQGCLLDAQGDRAGALAWLRDGAQRSVRVADPYVWIHAHCLDALAAVTVAEALPEAGDHVARLERVAAHGDLRELVVRAALHRGDPKSAALLAQSIDNPALHALLAQHTSGHTASW